MKSLQIPSLGSQLEIVDVPIPTPASDQVLVKSLWTSVNPVDSMIASYGTLVTSWPTGLGADAYGVVVKVGEEAKERYGMKEVDYVVGCTRIGVKEFATAQEYFLMDAAVAMRRPKNLEAPEAVTVGSAFQTAALGISLGLNIPIGNVRNDIQAYRDWILVLGGAGNVGSAAMQLLTQAGHSVVASCSPKQSSRVRGLGAVGTFDYHLVLEEQVRAIEEITGGKGEVHMIFDATSSDDPVLAKLLFEASDHTNKLFATTNDWSSIGDIGGGKTYEIHLGTLGRPEARKINEVMIKLNSILTEMFEDGRLKPQDVDVMEQTGLGGFIEGLGRKGEGRKIVVKIQDE